MKVWIQSIVFVTASFASVSYPLYSHAETTAGERVQESAEDAGKNLKKTGRALKDKTCEMVNGKLECVGKKAANKMRNAKDEVTDKANDVKKKID